MRRRDGGSLLKRSWCTERAFRYSVAEKSSIVEMNEGETKGRLEVALAKKRVQEDSSRGLTIGDLRQPTIYRVSLSFTHIRKIIAMFTNQTQFLHLFRVLPKSELFISHLITLAMRHVGLRSKILSTRLLREEQHATCICLFTYRNIIIKISLHINVFGRANCFVCYDN